MLDRPNWSLAAAMINEVLEVARLGIVSDFDGTLSQFVDQAEDASITPENEQAIDALLPLVTVFALVSGRTAADLHSRFARPFIVYYGNHGMEFLRAGETNSPITIDPQAQEWEVRIRRLLSNLALPDIPGVYIENKRVTASIHYRQAAHPTLAAARIENRLRPLTEHYGLLLVPGNHIWEIRPPIMINKGSALCAIVLSHHLDGVIFLGDDETDLAAMKMLTTLKANSQETPHFFKSVSVGVQYTQGGPPDLMMYCDVVANGTADVARLLTWLADRLRDQRKQGLS